MVKVAAVQMTADADVQGNLDKALKGIAEAAQSGATLVLLPEMFLCMDGTQYSQLATATDWLDALTAACRQYHQIYIFRRISFTLFEN